MVVAVLALIVAMGGSAAAALHAADGNRLIEKHSLSGNRLKDKTLTGSQIDLNRLGEVPSAAAAVSAGNAKTALNADHAARADTAGTATEATDADRLGGSPKSAFQSTVKSGCGASSAIAQVNADGSVACTNTKFYSGRIVTPIGFDSTTFLTIPGVAHAIEQNCGATDANGLLVNDAVGTTDLWYTIEASGSGYAGSNWDQISTAGVSPPVTGGAVYQLGEGSGASAKVINITISTHATGTNCIFQGTAEVVTAG